MSASGHGDGRDEGARAPRRPSIAGPRATKRSKPGSRESRRGAAGPNPARTRTTTSRRDARQRRRGHIPMTAQPKFAAGPSGFVPLEGPTRPKVPAKTGYRPRTKPDLMLRLDGWFLSLPTLRSIAIDLERQAHAAHQTRRFRDRDAFQAAADTVDGFLADRRVYGEGRGPSR
jgi:hypothetical protein